MAGDRSRPDSYPHRFVFGSRCCPARGERLYRGERHLLSWRHVCAGATGRAGPARARDGAAQQRDSGPSAPAQIDALECEAENLIMNGGSGRKTPAVGPMILREPTYPRRATGSAMILEVERAIAGCDTAATDETTRKWSNVSSNFGDVTAGSIARRVWTNLFLRHFVEPESRPGVESVFPRYMYSHSYGWIDAQHFFGFIDFAERHYQLQRGSPACFRRSNLSGHPDRAAAASRPRLHSCRSVSGSWCTRPSTSAAAEHASFPRASRRWRRGADGGTRSAGVHLSGAEGELFSQLTSEQRVKFWTDFGQISLHIRGYPLRPVGHSLFLAAWDRHQRAAG